MLARVQNDSEFSHPFPMSNGVKQGCVLPSTLFSMMFLSCAYARKPFEWEARFGFSLYLSTFSGLSHL